jgi:hypothetical protein
MKDLDWDHGVEKFCLNTRSRPCTQDQFLGCDDLDVGVLDIQLGLLAIAWLVGRIYSFWKDHMGRAINGKVVQTTLLPL